MFTSRMETGEVSAQIKDYTKNRLTELQNVELHIDKELWDN